jgi:hypothetical protein
MDDINHPVGVCIFLHLKIIVKRNFVISFILNRDATKSNHDSKYNYCFNKG